MTDKIMPNEVYVTEFGAVIRTRCLPENITDAMIHQRVIAANLAVGDYVRVQCLTHDQCAVTHFAEYLVYDRRAEMKRMEVNDRETRTYEDVSFSVLRTTDWQATPAAETKSDTRGIRWNPGAKAHEVVGENGDVLAAFTKDDGGKAAAEAFLNEAA